MEHFQRLEMAEVSALHIYPESIYVVHRLEGESFLGRYK
jgi:hypothetical protein